MCLAENSVSSDATRLVLFTTAICSDLDPDPNPDPGVLNEEKNRIFRRNRNRRIALPIRQEIKFIFFKSEPKKEDIIADILLMRANL